jgi:hypothetical protein
MLDVSEGTKNRVELDATLRPTEPEEQIGAAGLEGVAIYMSGLATHEARLLDRTFDAVVDWVMRRRDASGEEVAVAIYGPDGEVLKSVLVEADGALRDWPLD